MEIKRARKEAKKPPRAAASNANAGGGSLAMPEMPPHGPGAGADHIQPPPLPPGVYFSPMKEECLGLLNRSIAAGHSAPPDARGYIFRANVYDEGPDALRRRHPPSSTREGDRTWWFLSQTRFQSQTARTKRADRGVKTGGYWRVEQSKKKLEADSLKSCFRFYTGSTSKLTDKTPWLMQEFTSAMDDGAGKRGVPALYRVYVTPHATDDQLRDTYGEDGVNKCPGGKKKPARAVVPEEYFDAIAALLPGSAHGENVQLPQAPPPSPANLRQYRQLQEQYLRQYYHRHQQQHQQAPFFGVPPPLPLPVSPDLLSELAADTTLDNHSVSMAKFMGMFNEKPAVMANEEPAETVKEDRGG
ncbi:hypothetical protein ACQ4PT_005759 [Festuca glaucescens]